MVSLLMSDLFRHSLNIHSSDTVRDLRETDNIYIHFLFRKYDRYLMADSNYYLMLILNLLVNLKFYISFYNSIT